MFGLIASAAGNVSAHELAAMAGALRGSTAPPSIFRDERGMAGLIGCTAGILPEDQFDRQPLIADDLGFVAQARIDNRDDVLARLGVPSERRATLADSDVLHLAYHKWGEDCMQSLTGDYTFAAWHRNSGRVVVATDHVGSMRLHFATFAGRLVLSTQLGAVLANPNVPRDLNLDALGLLVAPRLVPGTTPYKFIQTLTGGHLLVYDAGEVRCRRWWNPDTTIRTHLRDPRDYVLQARALLDGAVKACLRTTSKVAATMSGGLDSTLVAATAAVQLGDAGQTLSTYTSVPEPGLASDASPGWEVDDSNYARAVAQLHGNIEPHFVSPGGRCTLDVLPAIHDRSHTPVRNGANHIWMSKINEAATARGARVVLMGLMGNATMSFSGDGAVGSLLRDRKWRALLALATQGPQSGGALTLRAIARDVAGRSGRALYSRLSGRNLPDRYGQDLFTPEFRAAHLQDLRDDFVRRSLRDAQIAFTTGPLKTWAADPLPQWNVQVRDPLADRTLIECLLSFPLEAFVVGGRMRGLAREVGRGLLPDIVRLRESRGHQMPEAAAMIAAHAATYRLAFDQVAASPVFRTIVEIDRLHELLERLCRGDGSKLNAATVERALDAGLFITEAKA